jgi:hypothetical protein
VERRTEVAMSDPSAIEAATKRLQAALDLLESAAEQWSEKDRSVSSLTEQVHAFESDRARLAADLDGAVARSRALEAASREVGSRLDLAIENVRGVLDVYDRHDAHDR